MRMSFLWRGLIVEGDYYEAQDEDDFSSFEVETIETMEDVLPDWLEDYIREKWQDHIQNAAFEHARSVGYK